MNALKLTLWGDFAEIEGNQLSRNLLFENILLASRVLARRYKGVYIIHHFQPLHFDNLFSLPFLCTFPYHIKMSYYIS